MSWACQHVMPNTTRVTDESDQVSDFACVAPVGAFRWSRRAVRGGMMGNQGIAAPFPVWGSSRLVCLSEVKSNPPRSKVHSRAPLQLPWHCSLVLCNRLHGS